MHAIQKHITKNNETRPDTIDLKICRLRLNTTRHMTSQLRDLTPQEVKIVWTCTKVINERVLKASSRFNAFYASYLQKKHEGPSDPPTEVRGLNQ